MIVFVQFLTCDCLWLVVFHICLSAFAVGVWGGADNVCCCWYSDLQGIIAIKSYIDRHNSRFLQCRHCAVNCLWHRCSSGEGAIVCKSHATHLALIAYNLLCAMWWEGIAQLLRLTELKSHLFSVASLAETIYWWRRGEENGIGRKPLVMSFEKCHILKAQRCKPQPRHNPHPWFGFFGKQTC